jgi:hypothetical protein
MDLTKEKYDAMMNMLLDRAKHNREKYGYRDAGKFTQCALIIGPKLEQAISPLAWKDEREKRAQMHALSKAAEAVAALAVVLITDTRWSDSDKISDYFKLPPVKEIGIEKWQELYGEVLSRYGGRMENLPRELWTEAVCIIGKGPMIETRLVSAHYREGPLDTVEWVGDEYGSDEGYMHRFDLLPQWWAGHDD